MPEAFAAQIFVPSFWNHPKAEPIARMILARLAAAR